MMESLLAIMVPLFFPPHSSLWQHNHHKDLYEGSVYVTEDITVYFSTDARFKGIHSLLRDF